MSIITEILTRLVALEKRFDNTDAQIEIEESQPPSGWTDDGTVVRLTTSTDNVSIGQDAEGGKLQITGDTDEEQLIVKANSTQTDNIAEAQDSAGVIRSGIDSIGRPFSTLGTAVSNYFSGSLAGNTATSAVDSTGLGYGALLRIAAGTGNSAVGSRAGHFISSGSQNMCFGAYTLYSCQTGGNNLAIGYAALRDTTGDYNIALGSNAGRGSNRERCIFVGGGSGYTGSGNYNVYIGYFIGFGLAESNRLRIGYNQQTLIYGEFDNDAVEVNGSLSAIGQNDAVQLVTKANATQTANTVEVQSSSGEIGIATSPDTKDLRFYDVGASNYVGFKAPALTANQIWALPDADGQPGNLLSTDGAGNLGWAGTPIVLSAYDAEPARGSETNLHGGILSLAMGQALNSGSPINVTKGTGKLLIVINAGSDVAGSITVTGESIDRETGASTPGDTNSITVDALSTDGTTTDGNGNTIHAYTGAYITSDWFTGSVALSTTNLTLTDVDVYHVSFEQFNDAPSITIDTIDANIFTTNVAAEFDAYLYDLQVTGSKANVTNTSSLHVGTNGETAIANKYWRLRRGNINAPLACTTDGVWIDVFYSNSPAYVEDVNIKLWATQK